MVESLNEKLAFKAYAEKMLVDGYSEKDVFNGLCHMKTAACSDYPVGDLWGILGQAKYDVAEMMENPQFHVSSKGIIHRNDQRNIKLAIKCLGHQLRYDQFAGRMLHGTTLVDDAFIIDLRLAVDSRFRFLPAKDLFYDVVGNLARDNSFHPVTDYLDELTWDGSPRLASWLIDLAGAPDTEFTRAVSKIVLVAAVRRVRHPGCKFDEMMVLESEQGTNKSTALSLLAGNPDWFTDDVPLNAGGSKEAIENLRGRWIVECAEMTGLRKAEVEGLKSFLSRQHDRARMAYARTVDEVPRQSIFIGTTNNDQYLKDQTGNRRFWPIRIKKFDLEQLEQNRDQLWAEAVHLEAQGFPIRLDPVLYGDAQLQQQHRTVSDPWFDVLSQALGKRQGRIRSTDA